LSPSEALACAQRVLATMKADGISEFGVRIRGAGEYPEKLRDARHPVELLRSRSSFFTLPIASARAMTPAPGR
jgi:DNA processing protein